MKYKIFLLLFIAFFVLSAPGFKTAEASNHSFREKLFQQVQILKQEISLLQMLLANMQSKQSITSPSYLALNLSNNSIVLEKNPNQAYSIASITKLMTSVIAFENINKSQTIKLTKEMLEPLGHSPALFLGLDVKAEDLIRANLIQSTNDASETLSYFLGKERFIGMMNQKAKDLNMKNTFFYDAHGLSPRNISTSSDIANLLSYIHKNHPEILKITKDNNFWMPDSTGTLLKFQNVNNFYPLSSFIGGKTGYLPQSRQTLGSIFNVKGQPVAIVVLYSNNRQADAFSILRQLNSLLP